MHNYSCFDQLPVCDPLKPKGDCYSKNKLLPDAWCMERCGDVNFWCDRDNCVCEDDIPVNAPIEFKGPVEDPRKMPKRTMELRQKVMLAEATKPGLPECTWSPDRSCSNTSQYECVAGPAMGKCSSLNWYGKPDCHSSCSTPPCSSLRRTTRPGVPGPSSHHFWVTTRTRCLTTSTTTWTTSWHGRVTSQMATSL